MHFRFLGLLSAIFVTILIVSNIIAVKIGDFGGLFLPVAVVLFPLAYILSDVLTEVYGYAVMRKVLWTGFLCNLIAVVAFAAVINIPSAPFYQGQGAFASVLGSTQRFLAASFIAYLCGGFLNSFILSKLKILTRGKHLWFRTITSTVLGEGIDSLLFITIAFTGVFPSDQMFTLIVTQWLFKCAVEILGTPLLYPITKALKHAEKIDHYDTQTNFQPFTF